MIIKSREVILEFIQINFSYIPIDYCHMLIDEQFYHASAILYSLHEKHEKAIDIWKKYFILK
jgi:hypothetical protein